MDLVNSRWTDHLGSGRTFDRLPLPEWRQAFLARWSNPATGVADAPDAVAALRELRAVLRRLLEALSRGQTLARPDVEALNRALAASPRARRLEAAGGGYVLVEAPARFDWRWALAEVAASAAELVAAGTSSRLRVCANPSCSWMFYDDSRGGSRSCSTRGNLRSWWRCNARLRSKTKCRGSSVPICCSPSTASPSQNSTVCRAASD